MQIYAKYNYDFLTINIMKHIFYIQMELDNLKKNMPNIL